MRRKDSDWSIYEIYDRLDKLTNLTFNLMHNFKITLINKNKIKEIKEPMYLNKSNGCKFAV